jgi:hypothetical protein
MKNRRNHYRLLQVQADAPIEVIRSSFRALMRELKQHPDLGGSHWEATLLNEAYETLSDPKRRAEYDRQFLQPHMKSCRRASAAESHEKNKESAARSSESRDDGFRRDRRSSDRTKRSELISYQANGSRQAEARLVDFCPGGMLLLSREALPVKSVIQINSSLAEATACVTRCVLASGSRETVYSVGISFIAVRFHSLKGSFVSINA